MVVDDSISDRVERLLVEAECLGREFLEGTFEEEKEKYGRAYWVIYKLSLKFCDRALTKQEYNFIKIRASKKLEDVKMDAMLFYYSIFDRDSEMEEFIKKSRIEQYREVS